MIFFVAFYIYQFKDNHHFIQEKLMIFQILIDFFVNLGKFFIKLQTFLFVLSVNTLLECNVECVFRQLYLYLL